MGVRLGRTVHITRDDNSIVTLLPGAEVPSDLEKYFVPEKGQVHRAFVIDPDSPVSAPVAEAGEQESGEQGDGYDALKHDELKALLRDRELPQTGKVPDLIARLREDDAEKAGEQESGEQGEQE